MARIPSTVRAAIAASAFLAAAASARASVQDPAAEAASLDRLKFEYKCVFDIAEWKGKGAEDFFLTRLKAQRDAYAAAGKPEVSGLVDLLSKGLWTRKEVFSEKADHKKASEYASEITKLTGSGGESTKTLIEQADAYLIERQFAAAKDALDKGDTAGAKEAYKTLLGGSKGGEAAAAIFDIDFKASGYESAYASGDLDRELEVLGALVPSLEESLGGGLAAGIPKFLELRDRRTKIETETQQFTVSFFDTASAVAGVKVGTPVALDIGTSTFAFLPTERGELYPKEGLSAPIPQGKPLRLYRGTYDIRVYAAGQRTHSAAFVREVLGDQPLAIDVPKQVPEGMVYTPPPAPGRTDALFCDRIEVTVGQVVPFQDAGKGLKETVTEGKGDSSLPAWFIEEAAAREFEAASGKRIPTDVQWLWMAFGPYGDGRKFPWGDEGPSGERVFVDPEAKEPVARKIGGREKGGSPFGLEDMAGNLAEWVRHNGDQLWLLGGHNGMQYDELTAYFGKNPLRDPMPGTVVRTAMSITQQNDQGKYWFDTAGGATYATGLRMVVPVTAPAKR